MNVAIHAARRLALAFCFSLLAVPAFAAFDSTEQAGETGSLEITRITPEGQEVPPGRELVITFSRPVVPVGNMERSAAELPITISPALNCHWRWINTSSLACNLDEADAMKPATAYRITIEPGIKTVDGEMLAKTVNHRFITQTPRVGYSRLERWIRPGLPLVRVQFNQPVQGASLQRRLVFMSTKGQRFSAYVRPYVEAGQPPKSRRSAQEQWLVRPRRELPLDTDFNVVAEPGIQSAVGEERTTQPQAAMELTTFPEFKFLGLRCYPIDSESYETVLFQPEEDNAAERCDPLRGVALSFSRPISYPDAAEGLVFKPGLDGKQSSGYPYDKEQEQYSRLYAPYRREYTYELWLPGLKAAQEYLVKSETKTGDVFSDLWQSLKSIFVKVPRTSLKDEFGERLAKPLEFTFATSHRRPNYVLPHEEAVLEGKIDSEVPFYVNNLDKVKFHFNSITASGSKANQTHEFDVPQVEDVQFAMPLGVRKMLGGKSGAVYGWVETDPFVKKSEWESRLFAEVTPYQVQVKLGHFNTLVWVTDLDTGKPVGNAKVTIYADELSNLSGNDKTLASGTTDKQGVLIVEGTDILDPKLNLSQNYDAKETSLFVRVDKDGEIGLLPINSAFWISPWASGANIEMLNREKNGHIAAWGFTAQGVYRAGSTIDYKIYLRNRGNRTLGKVPAGNYTLEIIDPRGNIAHKEEGIALNEFGSFSGQFEVPESAVMGWYQFRLTSDYAEREKEYWGDAPDGQEMVEKKFTWFPLKVLVSDFTPSPFRVTTETGGDVFENGSEVSIKSLAKLHAGGPYSGGKARVTVSLEPRSFTPENPVTQRFYFGSSSSDYSSRQLFQKIDKLNNQGELDSSFKLQADDIYYGKMTFESAVEDERGKNVAGYRDAQFAGVDRFVGLSPKDWLMEKGKENVMEFIVADIAGNPVPGVEVDISIEHKKVTSSRVKGSGNAYETRYEENWETAGSCHGTSGKGAELCKFTPKDSGSYRYTARIRDSKDRLHVTEYDNYAIGGDYVAWDQSDYALEIIPEKASYKVGDTARYLVKNPYPKAEAMITIERSGVIDHFTQSFNTSTPVIEFPVKADYLPGYYLSVTLISPRVDDKPLKLGEVDLAKPAIRFGYVSVPVRDEHKEIKVEAKTDKKTYRPREEVQLTLHAEPRAHNNDEPIELAVAVLDESVFDLITDGILYFDPYEGFYKLMPLDLRNYSLLAKLVGRQKFEKKGANPGGDGGADLSLRDLFKFVSYWNPSIRTDDKGNANVSFTVPDNLTGWRVLVLAATPTDRLGLGQANFTVNRPTEVRPVMPNQVLEGDKFKAGFSVMNRTKKDREITVELAVEGNVAGKETTHSEKVKLKSFERKTILMPVEAATLAQLREKPKGELFFTARAFDDSDSDGITHRVPVLKQRSLEVGATYGTTTQPEAKDIVGFPKDIFPDSGEISVSLSPSVIGNVEGAFRYMRDYPYLCWEQKLTKGVMAAEYLALKAYMPDSFEWKESAELVTRTLKMAASHQAENGGMGYYIAGNEYADPYLSAYTALAFNWLSSMGYEVPEEVESKLHSYLEKLLREDNTLGGYSANTGSTVRAVALAALAPHHKIRKEDVLRLQPKFVDMSLLGKNYFTAAAASFPELQEIAAKSVKNLFSHANQTGGKYSFNETISGEEWDGDFARILATPMRENCALLSTITALGEKPEFARYIGDAPYKLVRTITQSRGSRDHWENTQENLFCLNALIDFSRIYEKDKPEMEVDIKLDEKPLGAATFADLRDAPVSFSEPVMPEYLGKRKSVNITRDGKGRLYYSTRISFAPTARLAKTINAGIEIRREYSVERDGKWQLVDENTKLDTGEIVRVDLFISLPAARNFVVVDDPVPGGLEPVNSDLATASKLDAEKGDFAAAGGSYWFKFNDWQNYGYSRWSFYHRELRHDAVRFYSESLSPGNYHLSYTAQVIAPGSFTVMPVLAQEMYDTDVYGKDVPFTLNVE